MKLHLSHVTKHELVKSKMVQVNKCQKLQEKSMNNQHSVDITGTYLKTWITVLSKYQPTEDEIKLIVKGHNFIIVPEKQPTQ